MYRQKSKSNEVFPHIQQEIFNGAPNPETKTSQLNFFLHYITANSPSAIDETVHRSMTQKAVAGLGDNPTNKVDRLNPT
jgi:hypothetical protein